MKTSIHKAVVAALGGLLTLAGVIFGVNFTEEYGIGPEEISAIGTVVTTFVVWYIPNKVVEEPTIPSLSDPE